MSNSFPALDVLETRMAPHRKVLDNILVLANTLLKDECPITWLETLLYPIDDTLLQLKLWGQTVVWNDVLLKKICP